MSIFHHLGLRRNSIRSIASSICIASSPTHLFYLFSSTVVSHAQDVEDTQKMLVINPQRTIKIYTTAITFGSSSSVYVGSWFHSAGSSKTNYYRKDLLQRTPTYSLFNGKLQGRVSFFKETIVGIRIIIWGFITSTFWASSASRPGKAIVEEKRWKRWVGDEAMYMEGSI
ncbi:hypothetical protein ACFX12_005372 [Malus domestica]